METSFVLSTPRSRIWAARSVSRRAASISIALSAIISRISWKSPMGRLNALRCWAYFTAASRAARATPTAPAAIPRRPLFRVRIACSHPFPRFPTRFPFGIRQSSNARSAVGLARSPSFVVVSTFVTLNPGVPFGTMKHDNPSWRLVPGSRAYTNT